jgi:hypothetical protein
MSIKTLLFAGAATFGLCASAYAQTAVQTNGIGAQVAVAFANQQTYQRIIQGRGLVNTAVQVQVAPQIVVSNNNAVQNNINIPVRIASPGRN